MPKVQPPELKGFMDKKLNSECPSSHRLRLRLECQVGRGYSWLHLHLERATRGHYI
jgi:hypothetical protein